MAQIPQLTSTTTLGSADETILRQGTTDKRISLELANILAWAKREGYIHQGEYQSGVAYSSTEQFYLFNSEPYFVEGNVSLPYTTTISSPEDDSNLYIKNEAYFLSKTNGINRLSNHNFLVKSPASITHPSATPTDYVAGTQIFSGVFVGTNITGLTYINGRVSFLSGDFYLSVPNIGGLEYVTEFTASVADFDGNPRTRGVSFAVVGNEYRVTVGVDALEDVAANPTPLGSVKLEQGGVATRHVVSGVTGVNSIESLKSSSATVGQVVSTGGTTWRILPQSSLRGITLDSGLKAIPLNGLWGQDAGVTYDGLTDDTAALNQLYQYGKDLEESFSEAQVATSSKPSIKHPNGICIVTSTINTGGNLISSGDRTLFSANGDFPIFTSSCYNTEWSGMQFDNPLGQWILFSNTTRIESSKCHIHDCDFYRAAPDKQGLETDTTVHYNYPMIFTIDNVKSYGSAFARLHTNGVFISDSWIAWDTDVVTVPLLECSDPLELTKVTEVPYGSNPTKLPRIWGPSTRNLSLKCNSVRFGGEATQTPVVATDTDDDRLAQIVFEDCAMFGVADTYWAEFYGNLPKKIKVSNAQGIDGGGFVNTLGMRVATTTNPKNYPYACLTEFGDDVDAVARRLIVTDDRSTTIPSSAKPGEFIFSKPKNNDLLKLINHDTGNGFSFFGSPYTETLSNANYVQKVDFINYEFAQYRFLNSNGSVRINSPSISPTEGRGVYVCSVYVNAENGGGTALAGYKFDGESNLITTKNDTIELGLNKLTWLAYYDGTNPIQVWFGVGSSASVDPTTILLGGLTVNKGDTVGAFVPHHTGAVSGVQEVSFGVAPPADGKWITGSVRYNTDGSSFGWRCTSGGSPGAWVTL